MNRKQSGARKETHDSAQALSQVMLDHHPDLVIKCQVNGSCLYTNQSYRNFVGEGIDTHDGCSWVSCIHPEDKNRLIFHLSQLTQEQNQSNIELRLINALDETRWIQFNNHLLHNKETDQNEIIAIGRDISDLKKTETELKRRIAFENLITKLSANFINLPPGDIDDHINHILSEIGRFAGVDRCYVILLDTPNRQLINTHEWCAEGINNQIQNLQNTSFDDLPWLLPKLHNLEVVQINNVSGLPPAARLEIASFQEQGIQSLLVVPVVDSGKLLGLTGFDSVIREKTWLADEVSLLKIVGGIIGSSIAQKQNQEKESHHLNYMEKLNKLSLTLMTSNCTKAMLDSAVGQVRHLIGADGCIITLWDDNNGHTHPVATSGRHAELLSGLLPKSIQHQMSADAFDTHHVIFIEDVNNSPFINSETAQGPKFKSLLYLPLKADDKKLGEVFLIFKQPHSPKKEEITIAEQVAFQLSQSCSKLLLLAQANRTAHEARTLHKAGKIVASTLNPEQAVQRILDQIERVVPFDQASIQILKEGCLEVKAGKGWPDGINTVGVRFQIPGENPHTLVINSRQPHLLDNFPRLYPNLDERYHANMDSWLGIPLLAHNAVIGMLTLHHHQPGYYRENRLIDLAKAFADQIAISLNNARLFAQEHQRAMELDALRATTTDITKELGLENLIRAILERATYLLNATGGELGLLDDAGKNIKILVSHNMGSNYVGARIKLGEGLMGVVSQSKKVEAIDNYSQWENNLNSYKNTKIHSAIAAPLMIGERFLGVIGIMSSEPERIFSESDKSLMTFFAQQAAIAVENSQLYEEQKRQARVDLTTNVYNRRGLYELGFRELERAKRYNRPLAVLMLDIDRFKIVNDKYGHATGDLILIELAERLRNNLRTIDVLGRYGGEEFVALLPETTAEDAREIAERLRFVVANTPFQPNNLSLSITISIGVTITSEASQNLDQLINSADEAMYKSKASGRNCVTIAIPSGK